MAMYQTLTTATEGCSFRQGNMLRFVSRYTIIAPIDDAEDSCAAIGIQEKRVVRTVPAQGRWIMVLNCKHVWDQISNYIEGDVAPELREAIEEHLAHCRHCAAVLDSTRNILYLIADDRTFALPVGYSERLHARLQKEMGTVE